MFHVPMLMVACRLMISWERGVRVETSCGEKISGYGSSGWNNNAVRGADRHGPTVTMKSTRKAEHKRMIYILCGNIDTKQLLIHIYLHCM